MTAQWQLRVLKTGELAHLYALAVESSKDCAAAGGAEVYGKEGGFHMI
jgi:hypothetical protein